MAPKDKPYSNETRPVDFGVNYTKRKGSKSIFARGKVKNKEGVFGRKQRFDKITKFIINGNILFGIFIRIFF